MFVPSTQTWSPSLYGLNLLFPWFFSAIVFCARPISASALFLACFISSSQFVTIGTLLIPSQSVLGVNPMIKSNGVSLSLRVAIDCVRTPQTAATGANCFDPRKSTADIVPAIDLFVLTAHLSLDGMQ